MPVQALLSEISGEMAVKNSIDSRRRLSLEIFLGGAHTWD